MNYPPLARWLMRSTGFEIQISGRRKRVVLSALDRVFSERTAGGERSVRIGDATLNLNLRNPSERLLYYAPENLLLGYRRSPLFAILSRLAVSAGLFVDVGANLGLYSLLARNLGLDTLLFEPEPLHFAFLDRNAEVIGRSLPFALSDQSGTAGFFVSGSNNPGSSSLVMPEGGWEDSEYRSTVPVRLITFDAALSMLKIEASTIRLIKIDVEGNEERTVLGMREYLQTPTAAPLWCEVRGPGSDRGRNSVRPVCKFLQEFDYQPFRFKGSRIVPFQIERDPSPQVFDLLFAVLERHGKLLPLR